MTVFSLTILWLISLLISICYLSSWVKLPIQIKALSILTKMASTFVASEHLGRLLTMSDAFLIKLVATCSMIKIYGTLQTLQWRLKLVMKMTMHFSWPHSWGHASMKHCQISTRGRMSRDCKQLWEKIKTKSFSPLTVMVQLKKMSLMMIKRVVKDQNISRMKSYLQGIQLRTLEELVLEVSQEQMCLEMQKQRKNLKITLMTEYSFAWVSLNMIQKRDRFG